MITTNNGGFPWRGLPGSEDLEQALAKEGGDAGEGDRLRELQDRAARMAIEAQVAAGCDLATDGLTRRLDAMSDVVAGIEGLESGPARDGFPGGGRYRVPIVRREVSWKSPILGEHYLFGSRGLDGRLKVVLTGPYTIAVLAEDHAYGEPMALAMALATALNQELRSLQGAGVPWIQVDEPALLARTEDFPVFTRIWEVLGRGVQTRLALNLEGAAIAPVITGVGRLKRLGCLSVDCVTVPENLAALAAAPVPDGVVLGLGLVSGSAATIEDPASIAARVRSTSGLPPADRLQLGTGTSLASLPLATAIAKLKALDGARRLLAAS
jgi:5-methyltetrahydropteroyltriglutamate--homocysteine methyltransferase